MDVVSFRIEPAELAGEPSSVIGVYVNGRPLQELARAVELPFARADRQPDLAGSYAGLSPSLLSGRHFLGEPVETWFDDGDTVLLGCTCGDVGCWPLAARVDVDVDTVTWRNFRNGHRPWDLSALGPFTFGRAEYESALA